MAFRTPATVISAPMRPVSARNREAPRIIIVGGGLAGLSAAYTLKRRGCRPVLLEASDQVGGRSYGDHVDGFSLDVGADFFCSSYDVAFRICEELHVPLVRSLMTLGWYRNGGWTSTKPIGSPGAVRQNLAAAWTLGLLAPGAAWALAKLVREIRKQPEQLSFASDSRLVELDGGGGRASANTWRSWERPNL